MVGTLLVKMSRMHLDGLPRLFKPVRHNLVAKIAIQEQDNVVRRLLTGFGYSRPPR